MARGAWGNVKPHKPPEAALFSLQESNSSERVRPAAQLLKKMFCGLPNRRAGMARVAWTGRSAKIGRQVNSVAGKQ
jgi:hypothetical protein